MKSCCSWNTLLHVPANVASYVPSSIDGSLRNSCATCFWSAAPPGRACGPGSSVCWSPSVVITIASWAIISENQASDGVLVDELAEQRPAHPRFQTTRRGELDRRHLGELGVGDATVSAALAAWPALAPGAGSPPNAASAAPPAPATSLLPRRRFQRNATAPPTTPTGIIRRPSGLKPLGTGSCGAGSAGSDGSSNPVIVPPTVIQVARRQRLDRPRRSCRCRPSRGRSRRTRRRRRCRTPSCRTRSRSRPPRTVSSPSSRRCR